MATAVELNKWLPKTVVDAVSDEEETLRRHIVNGLREAIEQRDTFGGISHFVAKLKSFLSLKYSLPAADLIYVTRELYTFVIDPELDQTLAKKWGTLLVALLRKCKMNPDILSPAQAKDAISLEGKYVLSLDWKILHRYYKHTYFRKARAPVLTPRKELISTMLQISKKSRKYYPESSIDEVWKTFMPYLCPHDVFLYQSQAFLCLFLPTTHRGTWKQWIDKCMDLWDWVPRYLDWDLHWVCLLASVAKTEAGEIVWDPYLPRLFTHFMRIIDVPVGVCASMYDKTMPISLPDGFPQHDLTIFVPPAFERMCLLLERIAKLVVYMMAPTTPNQPLAYLKRLVMSIKMYYHPSNCGYWTTRLAQFLKSLCEHFAKRVGKERKKPDRKSNLSQEDIVEFVEVMLPLAMDALYAKTPHMQTEACFALKHLAYLAPDKVLPSLLPRVYAALTTLTETHQTLSAMEVLTTIVHPMFKHGLYPDGVSHLPALLELTLSGIDANDVHKTWGTLRFYMILLSAVPLVAAEDAHLPPAGSSVDGAAVASTTNLAKSFEEWTAQFISRVFAFFELKATHQHHLTHSDKSGEEEDMCEFLFHSALHLFFNQISPALQKMVLKTLSEHMFSNLLASSMKYFRSLLMFAAEACPDAALAAFIPRCYRVIVDEVPSSSMEVDDNGSVKKTKFKLAALSEVELGYYLSILGHVVKLGGPRLVKYRKELFAVLDLTLPLTKKKVFKPATKLLRNALRTLTTYNSTDFRSVPPSVWRSEEFQNGKTPYKYWGIRMESVSDMDAVEDPRPGLLGDSEAEENAVVGGLFIDEDGDVVATKHASVSCTDSPLPSKYEQGKTKAPSPPDADKVEAEVEWVSPTEDSIRFAADLVNRYLPKALETLLRCSDSHVREHNGTGSPGLFEIPNRASPKGTGPSKAKATSPLSSPTSSRTQATPPKESSSSTPAVTPTSRPGGFFTTGGVLSMGQKIEPLSKNTPKFPAKKVAGPTREEITHAILKVRAILRGVTMILPDWAKGSDAKCARSEETKAETEKLKYVRSEWAWLDSAREDCDAEIGVTLHVKTGLEAFAAQLLRLCGNIREDIGEALLHVFAYTSDKHSDAAGLLKLLCKVLDPLLNGVWVYWPYFKSVNRELRNFKYSLKDFVTERDRMPRCITVMRSLQQLLYRTLMSYSPSVTPLSEALAGVLFRIAVCAYETAQVKALSPLSHYLMLYSDSTLPYHLAGEACDMICDKQAKPEQVSGAVALLSSSFMMRMICRTWPLMIQFATALCRSDHMEKLTTQAHLVAGFQRFQAEWLYPLSLQAPTGYGFTAMMPPAYARTIAKEEDQVKEENTKLFNDFLLELVEIGRSRTQHWRYRMMTCVVLLVSLRGDHIPPSAVFSYLLEQLVHEVSAVRMCGARGITVLGTLAKKIRRKHSLPVTPAHVRAELSTFLATTLDGVDWDAGFVSCDGDPASVALLADPLPDAQCAGPSRSEPGGRDSTTTSSTTTKKGTRGRPRKNTSSARGKEEGCADQGPANSTASKDSAAGSGTVPSVAAAGAAAGAGARAGAGAGAADGEK
eukprot:Rmarinus@m.12288